MEVHQKAIAFNMFGRMEVAKSKITSKWDSDLYTQISISSSIQMIIWGETSIETVFYLHVAKTLKMLAIRVDINSKALTCNIGIYL